MSDLTEQMREKYLESEDLWWMTEEPETVYLDIKRLVEELEDYEDRALERGEYD